MKIAYVRVSTVEQNEARQIEALEKFGVEKWFTEKFQQRTRTAHSSEQCLTLPEKETPFIFTIFQDWQEVQRTCLTSLKRFTAKA